MTTSLPVAVLVFLGSLITVLGLFVAGNIVIVALGLVAVAFAAFLDVLGRRIA